MSLSLFRKFILRTLGLSFLFVCPGSSESLLVGFNTLTPLQVYTTAGEYSSDFGPPGASAAVLADQLLYLAQPAPSGAAESTISALNSAQQTVQSFTLPFLVSDEAPGLNNTFWAATYNGTVYQVTTTGQVLTSFSTGFQNIGLAAAGGLLYTTEGDTGDGIDGRGLDGRILSTLHTGYTSLYGLGVDPTDATFYAGSFSSVNHFSSAGVLLNTLNLPGDTRTPNGAIHDGLEVADLSRLTPSTPVPELSTTALVLPVFLVVSFGLLRKQVAGRRRPRLSGLFALAVFTPGLQAAVSATLTPSMTTVSVGDTVTLTAQAQDSSNRAATFTYQFSVVLSGSSSFRVIKDFYSDPTLLWSPTEQEGVYTLQVLVRSSSGDSQTAQQTITVLSRVIGTSPVVTPTAHPLVALYSASPCDTPQQVRVRFRAARSAPWQLTPFQPCTGRSVNFLVAGLKPDATYTLQQDLYRGPFNQPGPPLSFRTGSIPAEIPIPSHVVGKSPQPPTSVSDPLVWRSAPGIAYDNDDQVVWYIPSVAPGYLSSFLRPLPGGTFTAIVNRTESVCPQTGQPCADGFFLREYDLVGHLVRETNADRLNEAVNALARAQGKPPVHLQYINHEGYRLPNGNLVTLVENEQVADQGNGPQDVLGDVVVVLDPNWQAVWYWNSFDHLDPQRKALLNDTCQPGQGGCPILTNRQSNGQYYATANDWTHCNSVAYSQGDGNLLVSSRHQAWVLKLAYGEGQGDGQVIWKLGRDGDFRLANGYADNAWFSYQHDAEFAANGLLTLFDNGNYRIAQMGGNSRGQAWQLDEVNRIATPVVNIDTGVQSLALGSAQLLPNGNYSFGAGFINAAYALTLEFAPSGALVSSRQSNATSYRDFRLHDLYATRLP